jgi:CRP-like cAMP-binding protein
MATFSSGVKCFRSFLIRSLRYLNGRTLSPFPTEAGQRRNWGILFMDYRAASNLVSALGHDATKSHRLQSSVLFRRGEKAFGIFLILSGQVRLDLGVDNGHGHCYGRGALLGFPETVTKRDHNMTATVIQDADIGFIPSTDLRSLLSSSPDLYTEFLALLKQRSETAQEQAESQGTTVDARARVLDRRSAM